MADLVQWHSHKEENSRAGKKTAGQVRAGQGRVGQEREGKGREEKRKVLTKLSLSTCSSSFFCWLKN